MAYRFFVVPIRDEGAAAADLNGFLRSHGVLAVDRRWVEAGSESFWSFCINDKTWSIPRQTEPTILRFRCLWLRANASLGRPVLVAIANASGSPLVMAGEVRADAQTF